MVSGQTEQALDKRCALEGHDLVGQRLANRYWLERLLEQDENFVRYQGVDLVLARDVCVELTRSAARTPGARAAPAAVRHPGIAELYDHRTTEDGLEFWVIEPLAGASLAAQLAARGKLRPADSVEIAAALALALGALHARGLVHGALSASNVVLSPTASGGRDVKLVGLAAISAGDPRADVVRLAQLVGHMVSGEEPDYDEAVPTRGSRPSFSRRSRSRTSLPELDGVLTRAIDVVTRGYASVGEFSSALWWALAQAKTTGRLSRDGIVPLPEPRIGRSIAVGFAIGLILLAAGISVAKGFSHATEPSSPTREAQG